MAREYLCPRCGEDITDTHESDDPSVGICGGWYCEKCDEGFPDEDEPDYDDYEVDLYDSNADRDDKYGS